MPTSREVIFARILAKTDVLGLYRCWVWRGATAGGNRPWDRFGPYPRMQVDCEKKYVHSFLLELLGRPRPSPDHRPDHLCRRRLCINPLHLEWVTCAENSKRASEVRGVEPDFWDPAADAAGEPVW